MKIAIALVLVLGNIALGQLPSARIPDSIGVNIHFTDPQSGEMEMIRAAGFKWVRMDFTWSAIEQSRGQYDFAAYDRLLNALDRAQMRALLILDYTNRLYDEDRSPYTDA